MPPVKKEHDERFERHRQALKRQRRQISHVLRIDAGREEKTLHHLKLTATWRAEWLCQDILQVERMLASIRGEIEKEFTLELA